jgi:hypothetical protein
VGTAIEDRDGRNAMVVKRRLLLVPAVLSLSLVATATPALGAFSPARPDPLAQSGIIRVHDIAVVRRTGGVGPVSAIGWREGSAPGQLYLTFSTNGGRSYRRSSGTFRRFAVLGDARRGMSVDICAGRVWAASVFHRPGDDAGDLDVLLTSRGVTGGGGQAFVTNASVDRTARSVSIACIGNRLLAIAWLETSMGQNRARLMLRSLEPLGQQPSVRHLFPLGSAIPSGGISVDANNEDVHVAWTAGPDRDLFYRRFVVQAGDDPGVEKRTKKRLAQGDIRYPQLGMRGKNVVLAYTDVGQVKARMSANAGVSFGAPDVLISNGRLNKPSRAYSADLSADRIVVETQASRQGELTPVRVQSRDGGDTWDKRSFGNVGVRVGALRKTTQKASLLVEAWQNNAEGTDTLRAQYEH